MIIAFVHNIDRYQSTCIIKEQIYLASSLELMIGIHYHAI